MREGNLKGGRGLKGAQAHYDDVQMVVQGKENNLAKITNLLSSCAIAWHAFIQSSRSLKTE